MSGLEKNNCRRSTGG